MAVIQSYPLLTPVSSILPLSQVLGNLVLSGSADGMILFWDLETGECLIGIQAHEGPVHSLDYNGHQHFFSSGGYVFSFVAMSCNLQCLLGCDVTQRFPSLRGALRDI